MSKSVRLYLLDLLDYIARLEDIGAVEPELFFSSVLHQSAVIRNFEVISEIVKRLARKLTDAPPNLP